MVKINETVKKETLYIATCTLLFSAILQAVFLIIGKWDITVLLGNILSGSFSVLNFLFMGIGVQKAVEKEEKEAKKIMKLSHTYRTLMLLAVISLGVALPWFNVWSAVIPYFFPRIAITFRPIFDKKVNGKGHVSSALEAGDAIINTSMPTNSMQTRADMVSRIPQVSETFQSMRVWNCAAISLASVACGRSDADYEAGIHLWDMAAGILLVREAGGKVSRMDGSPCTLTQTDVIASNGRVHASAVQALNPENR